MQQSKHIVIVAGEESGDIHAAALIRQLKNNYPSLKISGIGGQHMLNAGAELVSDLASYGVTGISEVLKHLKVIHRAFKTIQNHLQQHKPDLLILVDYPGFNLRLAKYAKKSLNLKIIYYISPQIWAWKAKRIHLIKQCVDVMAVIFPFEKPIYLNAGVPVKFVGHPLVEKIPSNIDIAVKKQELGLPEQERLIALLPGSRINEIERLMPILRDTALLLHKQRPDLRFIIPVAESIRTEKIQSYLKNLDISFTLIKGNAITAMAAADFVVVASGTASLECALLEKPMCIIYKVSYLTYLTALLLVKIKFFGLCNILANRMVVPEFFQEDCNPIELSKYIISVLDDQQLVIKIKRQLSSIKESLSKDKSDCTLYDLIDEQLN